MGLFSSKKKTSVGTSISRVVEDKMLPDSPVSGTITAIFDSGNIAGEVIEQFLGNIGTKAHRYYKRAESHYPVGMPTEVIYSQLQGEEQAKKVLTGILGFDVNIEYSRIGAYNPIHHGWERLVSDYGYDSRDNSLDYEVVVREGFFSPPTSHKASLKDMWLILGKDIESEYREDFFQIFGYPAASGNIPKSRPTFGNLGKVILPTNHSTIPGNALPFLRVEVGVPLEKKVGYTGEKPVVPEVQLFTETFDLSVPNYTGEKDGTYIHVGYVDAEGKRAFWHYLLGSGTYPSLDELIDKTPDNTMGTYFPRLYYRIGKHRRDGDKDSVAYKESVKLSKILGMDYQEILDVIHENPDINDVEQAMLHWGIPANSEDLIELEYLHEYFKKLVGVYTGPPKNAWGYDIGVGLWGGIASRNQTFTTEIRDSLFRMQLTHSGIDKKLVAGNLGRVGFVNMSKTTVSVPVFINVMDEYGFITKREREDRIPTYVYRKQISEHMVEEIWVSDPRLTYHIYGSHSTIGESNNEELLYIPLDYSITKKMALPKREKLYARSLQFVFNSRVTQKVKWYQRGIFKALTVIVAVAIVVFTKGAAIKAAMAVLAAGGAAATAMALTLLKGLLISIAVGYAIKVGVKAIGIEGSLIAAVVLIAAAISSPEVGGFDLTAYSGDLLQASMGIINESSVAMQDKLIDLYGTMNSFQKEMEMEIKTLQTAEEMLHGSPILTPFTFIGEKPQDYYNRVIHTSNPGLEGINQVRNYKDRLLQLPTFMDSFEDFKNANELFN